MCKEGLHPCGCRSWKDVLLLHLRTIRKTALLRWQAQGLFSQIMSSRIAAKSQVLLIIFVTIFPVHFEFDSNRAPNSHPQSMRRRRRRRSISVVASRVRNNRSAMVIIRVCQKMLLARVLLPCHPRERNRIVGQYHKYGREIDVTVQSFFFPPQTT